MGGRSGCRTAGEPREGSGGKLKAALSWWLDNGEAYRAAKEAAGEDGATPEVLEPPEIMDGFGGWYEDFWSLSTERQIGFGVGPIPASAIDRHVSGWSYEDADMFEFCIREMDGVYLMKSNKAEDQQTPIASPRDAFRAATSERRG